MSKKYILKKHIQHPMQNLNAGSVFIQECDSEHGAYRCQGYNWPTFHPSQVENNPEWFLPEKSLMELAWNDLAKENPMIKDDWISRTIFERGWDESQKSQQCK